MSYLNFLFEISLISLNVSKIKSLKCFSNGEHTIRKLTRIVQNLKILLVNYKPIFSNTYLIPSRNRQFTNYLFSSPHHNFCPSLLVTLTPSILRNVLDISTLLHYILQCSPSDSVGEVSNQARSKARAGKGGQGDADICPQPRKQSPDFLKDFLELTYISGLISNHGGGDRMQQYWKFLLFFFKPPKILPSVPAQEAPRLFLIKKHELNQQLTFCEIYLVANLMTKLVDLIP